MGKISYLLTLIFYLILLLLAVSVFWLFRPVSYIDNFNSYLTCNNGIYYQAGSNFIFSINGQLDSFNDKKARKICDHGIILDYGDTYSTNPDVNYQYNPSLRQDSSWLQGLFLASIFILIIFAIDKKVKSKVSLIFVSLLFSFLIFIFFLKIPTDDLFCQRKASLQSEDFKKSVNKAGRLLHEVDEQYRTKVRQIIYKSCLDK